MDRLIDGKLVEDRLSEGKEVEELRKKTNAIVRLIAVGCAQAALRTLEDDAAQREEQRGKRAKRSSDLPRSWEASPFYTFYLKPTGDNETHPADPGGRLAQRFRRNFRMNRPTALRLIQQVIDENWTSSFGRPNVTGKVGAPVSLLVLCALNALGRATVFDQFEELAGVSGQVVRKFFLVFCREAAQRLYPRYVTMPKTQLEFEQYCSEFQVAGLDGCLGCTDGVQVKLWKCAANFANSMTGKEGYPTVGFNVTVTFRRRILHSTCGWAGRMNDKSKVHHDELLQELHRGDKYAFTWTRRNNDGALQSMRGPYVIVDGGYQNYWCFVAPKKHALEEDEVNFTEWLESVRKCVECTFGILKTRFTILQHLRLHKLEAVNHVWFTCVALHNMLLEEDGLDEPYEKHIAIDRMVRIVERMFQVSGPRDGDDEEEVFSAGQEHEGDDDNDDADGDAQSEESEDDDGLSDGPEQGQAASPGAPAAASGSGVGALTQLATSPSPELAREPPDVFRAKLLSHWTWKHHNLVARWPSRTGTIS